MGMFKTSRLAGRPVSEAPSDIASIESSTAEALGLNLDASFSGSQIVTPGQIGVANGVASLDSSGDVPDAQIPGTVARISQVSVMISDHMAASDPHQNYQLEAWKGVANGYASLGADGLVPVAQLPEGLSGDYIPTSEKGVALGVATLGADETLDLSQVPATVELTTRKNVANGYCGLGILGLIPDSRINARACQVQRSSDFTLSSGVDAAVDFQSAVFQVGYGVTGGGGLGWWNASTNPSRITIPSDSGGGLWQITAFVRFPANSLGQRFAAFRRNGSGWMACQRVDAAASGETCLCITDYWYATSSNYIEFMLYQNSGSTLTISAANVRFSVASCML